jgi:hypothetical protein
VTAVVDFGWHRMPNGRGSLLSWYADCGAVVFDGPGGFHFLGCIADEAVVRRRLEGWEEVERHQPDALAWARAQVAGRQGRGGEVAFFRPAPAGGDPPGRAP